jgi:excisionase family DNA binding protein
MIDVDDLIPVPLAAERAKVSRNTMYLAARNGSIKSRRIGRDWFVYASDIERWKQEVYKPQMVRSNPDNSEDDKGGDE